MNLISLDQNILYQFMQRIFKVADMALPVDRGLCQIAKMEEKEISRKQNISRVNI